MLQHVDLTGIEQRIEGEADDASIAICIFNDNVIKTSLVLDIQPPPQQVTPVVERPSDGHDAQPVLSDEIFDGRPVRGPRPHQKPR
jgi:hypothetical protein